MLKRFLLIGMVSSSLVSHAWARSGCEASFTKSKTVQQGLDIAIGEIEEALVNDNRIPRLRDLAQATGLSETKIEEAVGGKTWFERFKNILHRYELIAASKKLKTLQNKVAKSFIQLLSDSFVLPTFKDVADRSGIDERIVEAMLGNTDSLWEFLETEHDAAMQRLRTAILRRYASLCKDHGRTLDEDEFHATISDTPELTSWVSGSDASMFGDFGNLIEEAQEQFSKSFNGVIDRTVYTEERTELMLKAIATKKRLLITTAVAGAEVDYDFLAAAEAYCKENDAALIVIPANMVTNNLDPEFLAHDWIHVLTNEVQVSQFLRISNLKISAEQADPLTGLDEDGPRSQSLIVGSPKMFHRVVATANNSKHPHMLLSTGAITLPSYGGKRFIPSKRQQLAKQRHRMGALILERTGLNGSDTNFHPRHIEYISERKGFYDVDKFYTATKVSAERPLAMVLGDLHVAKLDRTAFARVKEEIKRLKPHSIVIEDLFDGDTVNHHEAEQLLTRGNQAAYGNTSLGKEISDVIEILNELLALYPSLRIVVVRSNHDLWLDRWLESGTFMQDRHNQALGLLLAEAMTLGKQDNPLEYAINKLSRDARAKNLISVPIADAKRVNFLDLGEKYTIGPKGAEVLVGLHGHAGPNGSRGLTLKTLTRIANRSIMGHTHTVGRQNDAVNVGTLTHLEVSYNRDGASSWVQSIAIIGPNGEIQQFLFRDGEFFATDGNRKRRNFFDTDYPYAEPNQN